MDHVFLSLSDKIEGQSADLDLMQSSSTWQLHHALRITHYAFGDLGELGKAMRRAFHNHLPKDIKISEEIGIMLTSSFDDEEFEDLTVEQVANGPAEYSSWNGRNC